MIKRRKTKTVQVGKISIGSEHPISIQSMLKVKTSKISEAVLQGKALENEGCELLRVAVKDSEDAKAIKFIKKEINIPIVADIHFDYKLAIESIVSGVDKIRLNPGNLKNEKEINEVIACLKDKKIPVRIGANSGSLSEMHTGRGKPTDIMVQEILTYLEMFEKRGFTDIVLSLKASDVMTTIDAYKKISTKCEYPLHLGVTAAGPFEEGVVRSSIGIGTLLSEGIGDTIRVSLTGSPIPEVKTAKNILSALDIRSFGPKIISCPTCGRCQVDLEEITKEITERVKKYTKKNILVAIMGCEVNGPGEAKIADVGVAFGKDKGAIFASGKILKMINKNEAVEELIRLIEDM